MNKKANSEGQFSRATTKITATETTRKVEFDIPNNEVENLKPMLIKKNHAKGLYDDFFTINQQFLSYVLSIGLSGKDWEVFIWFMSIMDYGNKILMNQETVVKNTGLSQSQVSRALTKLKNNKVILEKKLNVGKYEISFNYDIINPQMGFKGKANKQNVEEHKALIHQETPYEKRYNIEGNIDLVNPKTGEVFQTVVLTPEERERQEKLYLKQMKKERNKCKHENQTKVGKWFVCKDCGESWEDFVNGVDDEFIEEMKIIAGEE